MGIYHAIEGTWISDITPVTDSNAKRKFAEFLNSSANIMEAVIYIFGVYMIMIGGCACYIKMKCVGKCCCITIYQQFLLILVVLCVVLSIFPIMIYGISEADINYFCETTYD